MANTTFSHHMHTIHREVANCIIVGARNARGGERLGSGYWFLDVARPPSRDPPPGDRLPGGTRFAPDGPEIRPGVGARPGNVKEIMGQRNCPRGVAFAEKV